MKYILCFLIILKLIYSEYSLIDFHEDMVKESGNYWITIKNMCFSSYKKSRAGYIVLYFPNNSIDFIYNRYRNYYKEFYFFFGHITGNSPKEMADEEIYLTSSWIHQNICHFLDNMFLYNIQNDNKYPPINHLIMADFNPQSTIPYNNMMLKMMINNYKPFKMSFQSEISKLLRKSPNDLLCYKTVHLYIRSENGGYLSVFRNYLIGQKYRDEGYKYLKISIKYKNEISITIINRKIKNSTRNIINLKMIKLMIREMGYTYKEIYFEDKNPKEQIESIMNSKIILKPYGSGIANIIWLISSKSLIIDCMSTYVMMDFLYYSYSLNYKYIPLFSLFHNLNPNTFDDGYDEKFKFENNPKITESVYHNSKYPLFKRYGDNMTISLKQIEFSLKYSLNYLKSI